MVRRWALAVTTAALVAACGQSAVPSASPSTSGGALSAYDQLRAQIGPNGEVTKEMALEAFSMAIAPLPGVNVPIGGPPNLDEQADATFAVLWIMGYVDQLTPDQRSVVDSVMVHDPNAPRITPQPAGRAQPDIVLADTTTATDYLNLAEADEKAIASELGRQLSMTFSLVVDKVQTNGKGADWLAYSVPVGSNECALHVEPLLQTVNNPSTTNATMAHEMFHCFQFDLARQLGVSTATVPDWIMEGQAEWAGENLGGPSKTGAEWWLDYLSSPHDVLFSRTYDAVGFYQHMSEEGINPWTHFDNMLAGFKQDTNLGAYQGASATQDGFLDTWASGMFRRPELGSEWNATGPWKVTNTAPVINVTVNDDMQDVYEDTSEVTNNLVVAHVTADILEVTSTGHVRMRAPPASDMPTTHRWLCFDPNECKCPPNRYYEGPNLEYVTPNVDDATAEFGLTGGLQGATLTLDGYPTDHFCHVKPSGWTPPPQVTPPPGCPTCGDSNGDPHLRTVNNYRYDFQAAGEFELLRSLDSGVDIQVRQQPYSVSGTFKAVAVNTALAADPNGHRVGVYATDSGLQVHVDGAVVDPASAPDLGSGAGLRKIGGGVEIDFPDGTVVTALSIGKWGINAIVQPSDAMRSGGGLLGPVTPGGMGVPLLPDGTQLPAVPDFETRHNVLYGQFADAWRVTDTTTLFDYDSGKSTASFTDLNFPSDADDAALAAALASPDPGQQAAADAACASVTDPNLVSECDYDVFATGDSGFAQQYSVQEDLYNGGMSQPSTPPSTASATPSAVTGAVKVTELQDLDGSTVGTDGTLYVSITDASGAPQLLAIEPTTAAIVGQTPMGAVSALHFAAGSVWAAGQATDTDGKHCTITRFDPASLEKVGDYPIPCSQGQSVPQLTSMGDAVWAVAADGTTLNRVDPQTNATSTSVAIGYAGGCCQDSLGAIFCYCGQSDVWRLTNTDAAFVDMGLYSQIFPAGTGFWADVQQTTESAEYIAAPGQATVAFPLNDERIVGGDANGVYIQNGNGLDTGGVDGQLWRLPADGSQPLVMADPPIAAKGTIDETEYDYLTGNFPWFATPQGYLHLWEFKETPDSPLALWLQWAPLP